MSDGDHESATEHEPAEEGTPCLDVCSRWRPVGGLPRCVVLDWFGCQAGREGSRAGVTLPHTLYYLGPFFEFFPAGVGSTYPTLAPGACFSFP